MSAESRNIGSHRPPLQQEPKSIFYRCLYGNKKRIFKIILFRILKKFFLLHFSSKFLKLFFAEDQFFSK